MTLRITINTVPKIPPTKPTSLKVMGVDKIPKPIKALKVFEKDSNLVNLT